MNCIEWRDVYFIEDGGIRACVRFEHNRCATRAHEKGLNKAVIRAGGFSGIEFRCYSPAIQDKTEFTLLPQ